MAGGREAGEGGGEGGGEEEKERGECCRRADGSHQKTSEGGDREKEKVSIRISSCLLLNQPHHNRVCVVSIGTVWLAWQLGSHTPPGCWVSLVVKL